MEKVEFKKIFNKYYNNNSDIELVIQKLKDAGASQIECVRTLVFELKIPLREADEFVLYSKAWEDYLDYTIKVREEFFDALSQST